MFATPSNIFSGFVVSLIALPLCLGLALARPSHRRGYLCHMWHGCCPFRRLIPDHHRYRNGLVIVLLGAITVLVGAIPQGYYFTLAAIIFRGIVIPVRTVSLGGSREFFPASALQGMLALFKYGILAKQFHVMLGITSVSGSTSQLSLSRIGTTA